MGSAFFGVHFATSREEGVSINHGQHYDFERSFRLSISTMTAENYASNTAHASLKDVWGALNSDHVGLSRRPRHIFHTSHAGQNDSHFTSGHKKWIRAWSRGDEGRSQRRTHGSQMLTCHSKMLSSAEPQVYLWKSGVWNCSPLVALLSLQQVLNLKPERERERETGTRRAELGSAGLPWPSVCSLFCCQVHLCLSWFVMLCCNRCERETMMPRSICCILTPCQGWAFSTVKQR